MEAERRFDTTTTVVGMSQIAAIPEARGDYGRLPLEPPDNLNSGF